MTLVRRHVEKSEIIYRFSFIFEPTFNTFGFIWVIQVFCIDLSVEKKIIIKKVILFGSTDNVKSKGSLKRFK